MKKSLFITIAILVIASVLCFAAFAEAFESIDSANTSVKATIDTISPVYSVTVDFGDMEFSYSPTWNPSAEGGPAYTGGTWDPAETNKILVTNKSNVEVNVSFSYTSWDESFDNVNTTFNEGTFNNESWTESDSVYTAGEKISVCKYDSDEEECSICAFLNLSGDIDPKAITTPLTKIGTVTVTVYAATN